MTHVTRLVLLAGAVSALALSCNGKQNTEDCSSNDECLSKCCYPSPTRQPWCSAGTRCMPDGSGGGGGSSTGGGSASGGGTASTGGGSGGGSQTGNGACAYYDNQLNRILCNPNATSASSCSGKYQAGASCSSLSCPLGTTNPQNCTFSGSSTGGGSGSGGGSGGGGGSTLLCGRYTVLDPGSQSSPGSGQVHDGESDFTWTRYNANEMTQAQAIQYCSSRGMRLPTRAEALDIAPACCVSTPTSMNCAVAFPGWQTWTTTSAGSGQAYYVNSHGLTCLPSTCIRSVTSTAGVMCLRE